MTEAQNNSSSSTFVANDNELLQEILDGAHSAPHIYKPGEYWKDKTENTVRQLRKLGLETFRSSANSAITSYGDNPILNAINDTPSSIKDALKSTLQLLILLIGYIPISLNSQKATFGIT
jgi:hypothetical protein